MTGHPTGTITFLLTDIESSTELWEQFPEAMRTAMARHDEIFERTVRAHRGQVVRPRGEGDSRFAVFTQAEDAGLAAVAIQRELAAGFIDLPLDLKVRMGLHTGTADKRAGDYYGSTVNRCARIRGLGHGGQILLSQVTAGLLQDHLPEGMELVDLGAHPLKGLSRAERIFQLKVPGLPDQFPPLQSAQWSQNYLPVPPTPLIGREREVAQVMGFLRQEAVRLLTLTGPGGTGKTRLSLEVGRELLEDFSHGVFFVDLAPISSPELVGTTIARSLGIREGGGRPPEENLRDTLAEKEILLILDNFEQIVSAAPLLADLLAAAPPLKFLVTSRIPLQLRGEYEFPVLPLGVPQASAIIPLAEILEYECIKLFVQRAQAVLPGFELTQENAPIVAKICRRLDGLPLAIEIAAARLKLLTPQSLLQRLEHSLRVLVGGAVDLPARHQTMRSVIDWSYNLLEPDIQSLFARLSVFVGGFTLESAESVCSPEGKLDVFAGVETLLNSSLLVRLEPASGYTRFDMLFTIREYAREKLDGSGGLPDLRRVHALHYANRAVEMGHQIFGPQAVANLRRIEEEHDNFRAAMAWSLEHQEDAGAAVQICLWLLWFWYRYGHFHEGREWSEQAMAATQRLGRSPLHAIAQGVAAAMAMWEGDLLIAARRAEEGISILEPLGDEASLSHARFIYGVTLINQGRHREAYAELVQAAEVFDQLGERFIKATALVHLANAAMGLGEFTEAKTRLDQAMPLIRQFQDRWLLAFCLNNYGELARAQGDIETAQAYYLQTEASFLEADALGDQARLIHTSGYLAQHRGETGRAWALFHESLAEFRTLGNRRGIAECLAGLAGLAAGEDARWAARLLGAAHALMAKSGGAWWPADQVEVQRALEKIRSSLDESQFTKSWQAGQAMGLDEAIRFALAAPDRSVSN